MCFVLLMMIKSGVYTGCTPSQSCHMMQGSENEPDKLFLPVMTNKLGVECQHLCRHSSPSSVMEIKYDGGNLTSATQPVQSLPSDEDLDNLCTFVAKEVVETEDGNDCDHDLTSFVSDRLLSPIIQPSLTSIWSRNWYNAHASVSPNFERIFFVEYTGVGTENLVGMPPIVEDSFEDTKQRLCHWANVTRSVACNTYLQLSPTRPVSRQNIRAYLHRKGESDDAYSSEVQIVKIQQDDGEKPDKWVVKAEPLRGNFQYKHSWRSILGELLTHTVAEGLGLGDLVPRVLLVLVCDKSGIRLGTAKPYIEDLQANSAGLISHTCSIRMQTAKIFSFLMGQWDLRMGNIRVRINKESGEEEPILIDNEAIVDFEESEVLRVNNFEDLRTYDPFMYIGDTELDIPPEEQGKPIKLSRTNFGILVGQVYMNQPKGSDRQQEAITVIVKGTRVYRSFPTAQSLYVDCCAEEVVARFDALDEHFLREASDATIREMDFLIQSLQNARLNNEVDIPRISEEEGPEIFFELWERVEGLITGVKERKASLHKFCNYPPSSQTSVNLYNSQL